MQQKVLFHHLVQRNCHADKVSALSSIFYKVVSHIAVGEVCLPFVSYINGNLFKGVAAC